MIFGIPYRIVGLILVAVAILGLLYFFGQSAYNAGASAERESWEESAAKVASKTQVIVHEVTLSNQQERARITASLEQAREQLEAAQHEDDLGFFVAFAAADRMLDGEARSG